MTISWTGSAMFLSYSQRIKECNASTMSVSKTTDNDRLLNVLFCVSKLLIKTVEYNCCDQYKLHKARSIQTAIDNIK